MIDELAESFADLPGGTSDRQPAEVCTSQSVVDPIADLFHLFEKLKIKPNLTQNAAISMICVLDDRKDKIEKLALAASEFFDINVTKGLTLLTIRHYTREIYDKLTVGRKMLLQQRTNETVQALLQ